LAVFLAHYYLAKNGELIGNFGSVAKTEEFYALFTANGGKNANEFL